MATRNWFYGRRLYVEMARVRIACRRETDVEALFDNTLVAH